MEEQKKEYKSFGYSNGWEGNKPEEVKRCEKLGHIMDIAPYNGFRCVTKYSCPICRISYLNDSSD